MEENDIKLSENHGLNPSLDICFKCGKDIGIILFDKLSEDKEAPRKVCVGHVCDDCIKELQDNNQVIFIECNDQAVPTGKYVIIDKDILNPGFKEVNYITESDFKNNFEQC